jgi:hypothetical protein
VREGVREHGGEGGFSDAAFAGENEDLVPDRGEARGYEGDVRIGAFGRRGAYLLVRAAGTVVGCAGLFGFGARAVFCEFGDCVSTCVFARCFVRCSMKAGGAIGGYVPGSGATSLGACLSGASRSTCVGSSREGAMSCVCG